MSPKQDSGKATSAFTAKQELERARENAKQALRDGDEKAFDAAALRYAELQRKLDSVAASEDAALERGGDVDEALISLEVQTEERKRRMEETAHGMRAAIESWKDPGEELAAEWAASESTRLSKIRADLRAELLAEIRTEKARKGTPGG